MLKNWPGLKSQTEADVSNEFALAYQRGFDLY